MRKVEDMELEKTKSFQRSCRQTRRRKYLTGANLHRGQIIQRPKISAGFINTEVS